MLIFVDICWYWSIFVDICSYLLLFVDICWYWLIFVDIYWYLLIFIDICRYCLICIVICWYWLIFVDICSYLSIFVDVCWYLIQLVEHTKKFWNDLVILRIDIYVNAHSIYQLFVPWCPKVRVHLGWYLLILIDICWDLLIFDACGYSQICKKMKILEHIEMSFSFCA